MNRGRLKLLVLLLSFVLFINFVSALNLNNGLFAYHNCESQIESVQGGEFNLTNWACNTNRTAANITAYAICGRLY